MESAGDIKEVARLEVELAKLDLCFHSYPHKFAMRHILTFAFQI
jgi:hypothetical protein